MRLELPSKILLNDWFLLCGGIGVDPIISPNKHHADFLLFKLGVALGIFSFVTFFQNYGIFPKNFADLMCGCSKITAASDVVLYV